MSFAMGLEAVGSRVAEGGARWRASFPRATVVDFGALASPYESGSEAVERGETALIIICVLEN